MDHDQLMTEILRVLEIDHQYVRHFREEQEAEIAQVRSVGRKAARELGWKVRTFQTDPEQRGDHMVVVWVMITQSDPDEDARLRERSELLFRNIDWSS